MKEKDNQITKYETIINSPAPSEDGKFLFLTPIGDAVDRLNSILKQKELQIEKLEKERDSALEKYAQSKGKFKGSQEFKRGDLNIDGLAAAREKVKELQKKLEEQSEISKKMVTVRIIQILRFLIPTNLWFRPWKTNAINLKLNYSRPKKTPLTRQKSKKTKVTPYVS